MDLREYLKAIRRGWIVIVAALLIGAGVGVGLTVTTTKEYQATAQVFVAVGGADNATQLAQGNTFSQARVQTYTTLATSPDVTNAVVSDLKLSLTARQLSRKITATAPQDKVLVNIVVTDTEPTRAAQLANAVANRFTTVVQNLEKTSDTSASPVRLTVAQPADVPGSPVTPKSKLNLIVGCVLGLILGIGVVLLRNFLDTTVKTPHDFEDLGLAVLGLVPLDKQASSNPIASRADAHGARAEAFRQLRSNLRFVDVDSPPRIIALTSALPGEGKSTTSVNLASALAEAGNRVCLIEADLRKPTLAKTLGLVGDIGLTTVLIGQAEIEDVLQNVGENFAVMTSGAVPPNPSELLTSANARRVIERVAEAVDYVILDTAPLLPVADGAEVASMAEATLLVSRAGKTTRDQVERAVNVLGRVGERPVGVVLNMASRREGSYDYYYGGYRPATKSAAKSGSRRAVTEPVADVAAGGSDAEAFDRSEAPGAKHDAGVTDAPAESSVRVAVPDNAGTAADETADSVR